MGWRQSWRESMWKPYVPVAQRRQEAKREAEKFAKKGRKLDPVTIEGRTIANTFWGKGWCTHLESFSDFENRLPRGRSYARNGSVIDLQVQPGKITALVHGSSLYEIELTIRPLATATWDRIRGACAGKIDSLVELLQGKLSKAVMEVVTDRQHGLFPLPGEMKMRCSCPDWAEMCKHVAATMYGVGARLDREPDLLFRLRGVDHLALIGGAVEGAANGKQKRTSDKALGADDLGAIFGIDLEGAAPESEPATKPNRRQSAKPATSAKGAKPAKSTKPATSAKGAKRSADAPTTTGKQAGPRKPKAPPAKRADSGRPRRAP